MRILCIYTFESYVHKDHPLTAWTDIPYGLATIAAILEQSGHEITTWVFCSGTPVEQTVDHILTSVRPELVAFTAVTSQFPKIRAIAQAIKARRPDLYTVLGGHHASLAPDDAMACPAFDAICVGEGDEACVQLAAQLAEGRQPAGISNLWICDRVSGQVERNSRLAFRGDLDQVPFVNRRHWARWVTNPD